VINREKSKRKAKIRNRKGVNENIGMEELREYFIKVLGVVEEKIRKRKKGRKRRKKEKKGRQEKEIK